MESTPGSFSKNCYDKANEAFTNDNYQKAIELYSDALSHDPCNVDYLCSRAHAYIKNDEFEKAKTDGNKAIGKKIYITCWRIRSQNQNPSILFNGIKCLL